MGGLRGASVARAVAVLFHPGGVLHAGGDPGHAGPPDEPADHARRRDLGGGHFEGSIPMKDEEIRKAAEQALKHYSPSGKELTADELSEQIRKITETHPFNKDILIGPYIPPQPIPAADVRAAIISKIEYFEGELDKEQETSARLVQWGTSFEFFISDVQSLGDHLIVFIGIDPMGTRLELVQHISQISILLCATKIKSRPARRLGFLQNDQAAE